MQHKTVQDLFTSLGYQQYGERLDSLSLYGVWCSIDCLQFTHWSFDQQTVSYFNRLDGWQLT